MYMCVRELMNGAGDGNGPAFAAALSPEGSCSRNHVTSSLQITHHFNKHLRKWMLRDNNASSKIGHDLSR